MPVVLRRSLYRFLTTARVPTGGPPVSCDDEAVPLTPSTTDGGVDMETSSTSSASEESWARGILVERRQPGDRGGAERPVAQGPPAAAAARVSSAEAAPITYPELRLMGAFGAGSVPVAQQPGTKELGAAPPGFLRSPAVSISTGSCSNSSSSSIGPVEVGAGSSPAAAAAAPPLPPPPGAETIRTDQKPALLSLLSSVPSPSAKLNTTAELNDSAAGGEGTEGIGDLELLDASEMEGAIDELLGEGILEGFGEGSGEEDILQHLNGIFSDA